MSHRENLPSLSVSLLVQIVAESARSHGTKCHSAAWNAGANLQNILLADSVNRLRSSRHVSRTADGTTWLETGEGQAVCCDTTRLARAALRPPVASHPSRGFSHPHAPTTRSVPAPRPRPYPWRPTVRRLDARQRHVPLHRQSSEPCSPDTLSVRLSRPTPRRNAFRLSTPDQPSAGWMRASVRRWTRSMQSSRP
jgi:hypothetical protein